MGKVISKTVSKSTNLKKSKVSSASSFWADELKSYDSSRYAESYWDDTIGDFATKSLSSVENNTLEILRLASHKRAIGNFVNILTNKNIPVRFYRSGASYTDGKSVVLSADVKPEKFDVAVGLALHEASHINLTDFDTFMNYTVPPILAELFESKGVRNGVIWDLVKNLTNWIEDRRIDQFIFDTCPGYRDYYRALYDEYFNDKIIDSGLLSDEYTDATIESYMFRIINLTNPNTKLDKLKGLAKIYSLVDLKDISRLKSTYDSLDVAERIAGIIGKAIDSIEQAPQKSSSQNGSGSVKDGESEQTLQRISENTTDSNNDVTPSTVGKQENDVSEPSNEEANGTNGDTPKEEANGDTPKEEANSTGGGVTDNPAEQSDGDESNDSKNTLSDTLKKRLDKKIESQKDFIAHNTKKKSISARDEKVLQSVEASSTELVTVGANNGFDGRHLKSTQCIVSKRMTEELMKDYSFPFAQWRTWRGEGQFLSFNDKALRDGIQLGILLGKRLAIRSEERVTDNPRQKSGKIDRRLISGLGYDYANVFTTKEVDKFKKANLHISLDGSGSMNGPAWDRAITLAIALCKAASMVSNLDIQLSIRGTWGIKPYICMAYDSRVDKFDKVKRLFPALVPNGSTPEGLCYEAIMKNFVPTTNDLDSYFLNICDGEPNFTEDGVNYSGYLALNHTKSMVKKIKSMGVNFMSYFVSAYSSYYNESSVSNFKTMYGDSARFIDISNIISITTTLNQMFLKK